MKHEPNSPRAPRGAPRTPDFPPTPGKPGKLFGVDGLLLLALSGLALWFRFYLNNTGIPGHVFPRHDEVHYTPRIVAFLNGEWGDRKFVNPSLYLYLLYAVTSISGWVLVLAGRFESFAEFTAEVSANPHLITVLGRATSIVSSAACVPLLFLIGRRMFSTPVAVLAAGALAVNLVHIRSAPLAGNESTMVFMVLLFFGSLLGYLRAPSVRRHLLCGVLLGLAISTKFNAGVQLVPFAVASLYAAASRRADRGILASLRDRRHWVGFVLVPIAFFAASPFILLEYAEFFAEFGVQVSGLYEGFGGARDRMSTPGWIYYPREFPALNNGLVFGLFCGLGMAIALVRSIHPRDVRAVLLLAAVVPAYLVLGSGSFTRMRFFLPAVPFVLLAGAWAFQLVAGLALLRPSWSPLHAWSWRSVVAVSVGLLLLVPKAESTHAQTWNSFGRIDVLSDPYSWIVRNLDPGRPHIEGSKSALAIFDFERRVQEIVDAAEVAGPRPAVRTTEMRRLIGRASTHEEFLRALDDGDYGTIFFLRQGTRVATRPHGPKEVRSFLLGLPKTDAIYSRSRAPYWPDFVASLGSLENVRVHVAEDLRTVLYAVDLP